MTRDDEHLRLLSVFHYVVAGLAALFSLFPIFHLILGLIFIFAPHQMSGNKNDVPPAFVGWIFVGIASAFIFMGMVFASLILFAGRSLAQRRRYMFCLVMAGIECLYMPFGTILGIFTIIVLMRDGVKNLFQPGTAPQPADGTPARP